MEITALISERTSIIPHLVVCDYAELTAEDPFEPQLVNVDGKWYLEHVEEEGWLRLLDVDDVSLSRNLEELKQQAHEHFGFTDLVERDVQTDELKLEIVRMHNFRHSTIYVSRQQFMTEACYNKYNNKLSLLREETRDFYSIYKINDEEPNVEDYRHILPENHVSVYYSRRWRKWD